MDLVPEGRHIFGNLTVSENLKLATWTRKDNNIQKDVDKVFELFPRLKERMGATPARLLPAIKVPPQATATSASLT